MAADGRTVELHKCAVIELETLRPVYSMEIAMGRLLLGEAGGLRVFPLQGLMKSGTEREGRKDGGGAAVKKSIYKKNGIRNGFIVPIGHVSGDEGGKGGAVSTCKLTTLRVKQTSGSYGSFFSSFSSKDHHYSQGGIEVSKVEKVVSIHPLSKDKFMVLDSAGVLHVFNLQNKDLFSEATSKRYSGSRTYCLDNAMKVQLFAVFPSSSTKTQIFWVSDGGHSIHIMSVIDAEPPNSENGGGDGKIELTTIKLTAIEAIFTSEKVQDIVPISKDSVLILGQGNIFLYGTA
uniref:Cleavage/polyadenylation specificity factor A subunit N-terminal domain-containing protein n=2 Tax=Oryza brachyantha TaxID=4533 RepID=J3L352_ORYBR